MRAIKCEQLITNGDIARSKNSLESRGEKSPTIPSLLTRCSIIYATTNSRQIQEEYDGSDPREFIHSLVTIVHFVVVARLREFYGPSSSSSPTRKKQ